MRGALGLRGWAGPCVRSGADEASGCLRGPPWVFERVVVSITHLNSLKYRYAKGELKLNQDFVHEGILGTVFTGRLEEEIVTTRDKISAVIPTVKGSAWVTQVSEVVVDPTDPFPKGYTLGDIWAC